MTREPVRTAAVDLGKLPEPITHTVTQGVPTLHAPRAGELTAGLFFRVGRADETLATAGITHLVEHLALHRLGLTDVRHNGATADTYTLFHVTGGEAEVVAHLNAVCAALRDLPLDRLETEKEILRTEAAGRGQGPRHRMPLWRYGPRGHGLSSYSELGTWGLTAEQVREWARTRFTSSNAVLWTTGGDSGVLRELNLNLPAGERFPDPPVSGVLPSTPAYVQGEDGHVVFDAVVRRSTAAALFADVVGQALFQDLRQEGGYSYAVDSDYTPRDAEYATLAAFADALPQKQDAVVGGFVDVLARLRAGRIERSELDSARAKALKVYDAPDFAAAAVPSYALNLLLGHRILHPDEHRAELAAVTVEDLREVAREMWSTALLQVPGGRADWAGFTLAPQYSESAVTGTRHRSLERDGITLTIGEEGVSLTDVRGSVTVRYDACAAVAARPDGARTLIGHDAFAIPVEPTLYEGVTAERIAVIDAGAPAAVTVRLGEREPSAIPRPRSSVRGAGDGDGRTSRGWPFNRLSRTGRRANG
ncbi:M16 family metallopeptidase [Streptomyces sp. NPDC059785]|uniref:M16 family metallopeptidase n=1 Tax=unclassified Streptomyces TaxID=2593676 RepID=UPI00365EC061